MRLLVSKFLSFVALAAVCTMIFSATAQANPYIEFQAQTVHLDNEGEATIEGYFENTGDTDAYVKWVEFDLKLTARNGQQMWEDFGIRHYTDVFVPAGETVYYEFSIEDYQIPEYHGKFRSNFQNVRTYWSTAAG